MTDPSRADRLRAVLACPTCRAALTTVPVGFACTACPITYGLDGGVPVLLTPATLAQLRATQDVQENVALRRRLARWP